jgi:molybdopterin-guanine dinucleotide biosynthesis protein A
MKHTTARTINGLILAGGKSQRMGHDKSLIAYHDVSQREYLFNMLRPFSAAVFTSCKITHTIPVRYNPLPDHFEFDSPLNGILTAFLHDSLAAWLTIPVDMPLIDVEIVSYLLSKRDPAKVATCFYDSDGKDPEPLIAIWEPHAHPQLQKFYQSGKISPRDFLKTHDTQIIEIPDRNALANINNPEELEAIKRTLGKSDLSGDYGS